MKTPVETFEAHRPLLFSIAYRMLGSVMEAEDVVQETYLRYSATPFASIKSPRAFLSTVTTRLCLDQLKSARVKRETYVGPWLPEPLLTAEAPAEIVAKQEMISMAFLVLLESLAPVERAVFLLREVFDYDYAEIAGIVEKSEASCRQSYHRAKQRITERRPRFAPSRAAQEKLLTQFLQAISTGDMASLTSLLTEEATLWADGGGKAHAAKRPIVGRDAVARFMIVLHRLFTSSMRVEFAEVNGGLAILVWDQDRILSVMNFAFDGEQIHAIRNVVNPDKLQHVQGG